MENSGIKGGFYKERGGFAAAEGGEYWLQWQVLVTALMLVVSTAIAVNLLRKRGGGSDSLKPADLWVPCWRNLDPRWLLAYRAFAFIAMAYLLYETVAAFGFFVFLFYTQWTFALVTIYFAIATVVSIGGCRMKGVLLVDKFVVDDEKLGFLEYLLQIIYQTCAGASMLTNFVFWCLLLPFMMAENVQLSLLLICMHSVNAVFLILDSALNRMPFTWFGIIYFALFSCSYVVFHWLLHACCLAWWPYPFLDLSSTWAPMWYLALGLFHVPCYGIYVWLTKAKQAVFSTWFPHSFVRLNKSQLYTLSYQQRRD